MGIATTPKDLREYLVSWAATTRLMAEGHSFSGHERNSCFLNTGKTEPFADISAVSGFDFLDDARALGFTDYDFDGDLDFWVGNRSAPRIRLMRNNLPQRDGSALSLLLKGTKSNRDAIGARVEVHTAKGSRQWRTVRAGEGFLSQSSRWLHFGFRDGAAIENLVVRWPGGEMETFRGAKAGGRYVIVEGESKAKRWIPPQSRVPLESAQPTLPELTQKARIVLVSRPFLPRVAAAKLRGPCIVNLWATWCAPCLEELDDFAAGASELEKVGLRLVTLNADDPTMENREAKVAAALKKTGVRSESHLLESDAITQLDAFQRTLTKRQVPLVIPTTFLVDGKGRVAVAYRGKTTVEQLLGDARLLPLSGQDLREHAVAAPGRWIGRHPDFNPLRVAMRLFDEGETEAARRYLRVYLDSEKKIPPARLADVYFVLSRFETELGNEESSIALAQRSVEADPGYRKAHLKLGEAFLARRDFKVADKHFTAALQRRLDDPETLVRLAMTRLGMNRLADVERLCRMAVALSPDHAGAHYNLAFALEHQGYKAEAAREYQTVLKLSPTWAMAANQLAWILSTASEPEVRNGKVALRYAESLCHSPVGKGQPIFWMTLAAARAETGAFDKAVTAIDRGLALLQPVASPLRRRMQAQRSSYASGKPWRES